jgi:hypothetical protein
VDPQLEKLMRKLGQAINESISASRPIADVLDAVKYCGYDVFVVLEVTVGMNHVQGASEPAETAEAAEPELRISRQDARFLESMKISLSPKSGHDHEKAA